MEYFIKKFCCKSFDEFYIQKGKRRHKISSQYIKSSKERRSFEQLSTEEKLISIERKKIYYEKKKRHLKRLIDTNIEKNSKFLTLTFAENVQDRKFANSEFNKFIKRMKKHKENLKYLAVVEAQKRGSLHFHILLFNLPYLKVENIRKEWTYGFIKINRINDKMGRIGQYISKYFVKDALNENIGEKQKRYLTSRNLNIYEELEFVTDEKGYNEIVEKEKEKITYKKDYKIKESYSSDDEIECEYVIKKTV